MNYRIIGKVLSTVFMVLAVALLLPAIIGFIYNENTAAVTYLVTALVLLVIGFCGYKFIPKSLASSLRISDGFVIVSLSWIFMSLIGAVPFVITGDIPNYVDAFFEAASGFSTTGSTILTNVEVLTHAGLFWRSFTHWLGGMGILVMTIALLPKLGIGGHRLMRAETTGLSLDKGTFTFNQSARNLYKTYFVITIAEFIILILLGMNPFDSILHTFGSVGTGGFSNYNSSVGAFGSVAIEMVIAVFILICGINFTNVGLMLRGKFKKAFLDTELRVYLGIVGVSTLLIAGILAINNVYGVGDSLRYSFFQVASIITTTGYATADFDVWPEACKIIIFTLMFIGGCAGSTGGGMKVIRVTLMAKLIKRGAVRKLHPNNIVPIKVGKTSIKDDIAIDSCGFISLYLFAAAISTFLICLTNIDMVTAFSAVVSSISNIGPGFNLVGPTCNFSLFCAPVKILLSFLMIGGRLELFTLFVSTRIVK